MNKHDSDFSPNEIVIAYYYLFCNSRKTKNIKRNPYKKLQSNFLDSKKPKWACKNLIVESVYSRSWNRKNYINVKKCYNQPILTFKKSFVFHVKQLYAQFSVYKDQIHTWYNNALRISLWNSNGHYHVM